MATSTATPSRVRLTSSQQPTFLFQGIKNDSADKASHLLQKNHEEHHIFFNQEGFHNHIVHHLLTLLALGATPAELQAGYDENAGYQRPAVPTHQPTITDLRDKSKWPQYLDNEKYYHDFLVYFQQEMDKKGWQAVLNEHLFSGDEHAEDLLVRTYAGFLHPLIHLGFGVEFEQPAIIAEALAQAAAHNAWIGKLLLGAEKAAAESKEQRNEKTIVELLQEIRGNEKLKNAALWSDGNKIRDGIMARAPQEILDIAKQFRVKEEDLERRTAEMIDAAVYFTAAAQRPPHEIKFDFFLMHCVTSSIFFSTFLSQPWLSMATKCRLLEWKVRVDLAMYTSRGCPDLLYSEMSNYVPKTANDTTWEDVFERVRKLPDDGHTSKFIRALANGENACGKWEGEDEFKVKGNGWKKIAHAVMDSVEGKSAHWVRSCGFEEAWKDIPLREGKKGGS